MVCPRNSIKADFIASERCSHEPLISVLIDKWFPFLPGLAFMLQAHLSVIILLTKWSAFKRETISKM